MLGPVQDRARGREPERAGSHAASATTSAMRGRTPRRSGRPRGPARRARRPAPRRAAPGCRDRSCGARGRARRGTGRSVSHCQSMPSCRAVPGMSSTASITSTRKSSAPGPHRREADPAVAHDGGGDAVVGRRRHLRIPDRLAVVVGVDVDPAGCHEGTVGVDLAAASPVDRADLDDLVAVDGDIGGAGRRARPVDDVPAPDHEIVHGFPFVVSDRSAVRTGSHMMHLPYQSPSSERTAFEAGRARCS